MLPGSLGGAQLLGTGGQYVGERRVDGQGGQGALVLGGECLAVHRSLSVDMHAVYALHLYV